MGLHPRALRLCPGRRVRSPERGAPWAALRGHPRADGHARSGGRCVACAHGGQHLHAEPGNARRCFGTEETHGLACSAWAVVPSLSLWDPDSVLPPPPGPASRQPLPTRALSASTHANCAGGSASQSALHSVPTRGHSSPALLLETDTGSHSD